VRHTGAKMGTLVGVFAAVDTTARSRALRGPPDADLVIFDGHLVDKQVKICLAKRSDRRP
jgi:hypothetical protein